MESIAEIKKVFADADISEYSGLIEKYGDDERDGVKKIIASAQKKINALEKEKARRSYRQSTPKRSFMSRLRSRPLWWTVLSRQACRCSAAHRR